MNLAKNFSQKQMQWVLSQHSYTLFIFLSSSLAHRVRQEVTAYEPCSFVELAGTFSRISRVQGYHPVSI